jgi:hypothetical protein
MPELTCTIPVPQTLPELDAAVKQYYASDLEGEELLCQWQAIRDGSLKQTQPEAVVVDLPPGDDSY